MHVVARAERLLRLEMYWQCVGCGQRLPSAAPLQEEAQCAGGACARAARTWVAEGCVAIDDGTAECRLWADGETLTDGVLRVVPSLLALIKAAMATPVASAASQKISDHASVTSVAVASTMV